jgi:hypothetical protein
MLTLRFVRFRPKRVPSTVIFGAIQRADARAMHELHRFHRARRHKSDHRIDRRFSSWHVYRIDAERRRGQSGTGSTFFDFHIGRRSTLTSPFDVPGVLGLLVPNLADQRFASL